jgi:hypothetical protein
VIDVRNDGDVADSIHERESGPALVGAEEGAAISCVIASGQLPALIGRNPQIAKSALFKSTIFQEFARKSGAWSRFR